MSLPKTQSTLLASAGEHLVLSHLLRRGLIASIAPPNTEHYDIVITNKAGGSSSLFKLKQQQETHGS